jgi:predicted GTPase
MSGAEMTFGTNPRNVRDRLHEIVASMPVKVVARITGRTSKAVEKWRAGENLPNAQAIFALARKNDAVWRLVQEECGRVNDLADAEAMIARMRELLAKQ